MRRPDPIAALIRALCSAHRATPSKWHAEQSLSLSNVARFRLYQYRLLRGKAYTALRDELLLASIRTFGPFGHDNIALSKEIPSSAHNIPSTFATILPLMNAFIL